MPAAAAPLILFAHGAGAPSRSPWMAAWADRLRTLGEVVTFDYPYMVAGRSPDTRWLFSTIRSSLVRQLARACSA